ncbi:metallo-beta-lactamase [Peptoniphilus lacrimalis DNF00528]|nr:metallo-beta-lactamase [Peptoniphilus lacrimalis DNF00528]
MDKKIIRLTVGPLQENCYIVYNKENECVIIDPGYESQRIIDTIENEKLKPLYILLTHGHIDHIGAVKDLKDKYGIFVYIHNKDKDMLEKPNKNSASLYGMSVNGAKADYFVKEGNDIKFSDDSFKVIETPGHTGGGVCYKLDNILFSGDTLFLGSIGRYDFPESSGLDLMNSLKKLTLLDKDTIVLPGHGPETSIEYEINYNPYLKRL